MTKKFRVRFDWITTHSDEVDFATDTAEEAEDTFEKMVAAGLIPGDWRVRVKPGVEIEHEVWHIFELNTGEITGEGE